MWLQGRRPATAPLHFTFYVLRFTFHVCPAHPPPCPHHPRHEPPRPLYITPILLAEPGHQVLLLFSRSNHLQHHPHAPARQQKPVGGSQGIAEHRPRHRRVKRMPHPPIRPTCDQRMFLSRHYRVRQIPAQAAECPDQQRSRSRAQTHAHPTQPGRQRHSRPTHRGRVD